MATRPQADRSFPHNLEAEKALLGSVLLDNRALDWASAHITRDDFFSEQNRIIFGAMQRLQKQERTIDLITLCEDLKTRELIARVGNEAYIAGLADGIPIGIRASVEEYCRIILQKSRLRQIVNSSQRAISRAMEQIDESSAIVEDARRELESIVQSNPTDELSLVPVPQFLEQPHREIEWLVGGLIQKGANGFIGGAPKSGKSWAALDLLIGLALGQGHWLGSQIACQARCGLISREDNPGLTRWRVARLLDGRGIDYVDLQDRLWINTREQTDKFKLDEPSCLRPMAEEARKRRLDLVVLDVLNVLHGADENDATEMRRVMDSLAEFQRISGSAWCAIHHFSKQEQGTMTQQLRGSSAIAGAAEWVVGIYQGATPKSKIARFELKAGNSPDPYGFRLGNEGQAVIFEEDPTAIPPASNFKRPR